ncbi:MAG: hypothetical protein ABR607_15080 [Pyrinomonadaceae bacterium]
METTRDDALVSADDNRTPIAAQTIGTPRFDEGSIQRARPAVPLGQIKARRLWRLGLILISSSILVGGIVWVARSWSQKRSEQILPSAVSVAPEGEPQTESAEQVSPSVAHPEERPTEPASGASKGQADEIGTAAPPRESRTVSGQSTTNAQDRDSNAALHGAFEDWIAATNARDLQREMDFYSPTVNAFYLRRDVPREAVRAEKSRVFSRADVIDIRAAAPGIRLSPDGRTATMRFRKKYTIKGGGQDRRGETVQELRWRQTEDGWKIVGERDLRVIH